MQFTQLAALSTISISAWLVFTYLSRRLFHSAGFLSVALGVIAFITTSIAAVSLVMGFV